MLLGTYYREDETQCGFFDLKGNPVERTPRTNPYDYDTFVVWKSPGFLLSDYAISKEEKFPRTGVVDDDRMRSWDRSKYSEAINTAWPQRPNGGGFSAKKPEDISKFLSAYFGVKVKLTAMLQSCNQATGYPYWTFYYQIQEEKCTNGK